MRLCPTRTYCAHVSGPGRFGTHNKNTFRITIYFFLHSFHIFYVYYRSPSVVLMHYRFLNCSIMNNIIIHSVSVLILLGKLQNCGLCVNFLPCWNIYLTSSIQTPICAYFKRRCRKYSLSDGLSSLSFVWMCFIVSTG